MDFSICQSISDNINKVIVGKKKAIELMLVTILVEGNLLVEDVPRRGQSLAHPGSAIRNILGEIRKIYNEGLGCLVFF